MTNHNFFSYRDLQACGGEEAWVSGKAEKQGFWLGFCLAPAIVKGAGYRGLNR